MNIELRKYGEEYLILNNIETWPKEWCDYIKENIEIIEDYFDERKKSNYSSLYTNKNYEDIESKFKEILLNTDCELICYHATRLVDYEVEDIKQNGLATSTEDLINKKIDLLKRNSLINDEERDILKKINLLNKPEQKKIRENKINFCYGKQKINLHKDNNSSLYNFYANYGGEIINFGLLKENKDLQQKLNKLSKPYLIICSIKLCNIEDAVRSWAPELIEYFYKKGCNEINKQFSITSNYSKVLDIIEIDENSVLKYN